MTATTGVPAAPPSARVPRLRPRDRRGLLVLLEITAVLTATGWTLLAAVVVPRQMDVGGRALHRHGATRRHAARADPLA
ncbi:MAG TPA: hypothetical protein VIH01_01980 [Blastococcus sp.]